MQSIPVDNTTSGKEMVIAFGAVLIAAIIFFIVKNYVSKMLVANQRKSPRSADMAGWSLLAFVVCCHYSRVSNLNSTKFLSLPYLIPLGLAMMFH